jgi:hypothetical protein
MASENRLKYYLDAQRKLAEGRNYGYFGRNL